MKNQPAKRTFWKSVLSVAVLGVFITLSTGSYEMLFEINNLIFYDEPGMCYHANWKIGTILERMACGRDEYGSLHGEAVIEKGLDKGEGEMEVLYSEKSTMVNGKRHGETEIRLGETLFEFYITLGIAYAIFGDSDMPDQKATTEQSSETSAFEILTAEYPITWYTLFAFGYDSTYMNAYLDTLETILNAEAFAEPEFDDHYQGALAVLEGTPYDSIISANMFLSLIQGFEELKRSELRMAVIDRYRTDASTTFGIVQSTYPGYLLKMHEGDVADQDFEEFCHVMDSIMNSCGPLDVEDPYFLDSIDVRMYRALDEISPDKKSALPIHTLSVANSYFTRKVLKERFSAYSSIEEVAEVVLFFMYLQFDQADVIKKAVKKSWSINHEIIYLPVAGTEFSANNSGSSVTLNGYIFEDGGAEVTERGIVWAETYDPTTGDNRKDSGTGTGKFTVQLDGLEQGTIYYARAFATNSAGTAYGNCVKFMATEVSGIQEGRKAGMNMNIYPNPATSLTNFRFHAPSTGRMELSIIDLNGKVVYKLDLGVLPIGEHQLEMDLSLLQDGIYNCQITERGKIIHGSKLVIAR